MTVVIRLSDTTAALLKNKPYFPFFSAQKAISSGKFISRLDRTGFTEERNKR
jgi:hypothetical protein